LRITVEFILLLFFCFFVRLSTAQETDFDVSEGTVVFELLDQSRKVNDPDSVRVILKNAYNIANSINDSWAIERTLAELSYFEKKQGNLPTALRYALQVIREGKRDQQDNQMMHYEMMIQMGDIYELENLHDQAKTYYQQALEIIGDDFQLTEGTALYEKIGKNYFLTGQPDSGMVYFSALEKLYLDDQADEKCVELYQELVTLYKGANLLNEALGYNKKIKKIIQQENNPKLSAAIDNNIGYIHSTLGNHEKALEYFIQTRELCKKKAYVDQAALLTNIGITYHNLKRSGKAIDFLRQAEKVLRKSGDPNREMASLVYTLAVIYLNGNDIYNAKLSIDEAQRIATRNNNQKLLTDIYASAGSIDEKLYQYESALDYYQRHLTLRDSFLLEDRKRQQDLLQQQFLLNRSEKEMRLVMVQQDIQKLMISQLNLEKDKIFLESEKLQLENKTKESELIQLQQERAIQEAEIKNKVLETERTEQTLRLTAQRLETEQKERAIGELRQKEELERLKQQSLFRENDVLKKDKDLLTKDKNLLTQQQALDRLNIEKRQGELETIYILSGIGFLILLMILAGLFYSRKANQKLAQQNEQIENQKVEIEKSHQQVEEERQKAEEILLNILPAETARELKETGVAIPKNYEMVSVLFSDFSSFTSAAEEMNPDELIKELNICFMKFDEIMEQNNMEKIKTIGDSYMCAGGIPATNKSNPIDAVNAAVAMQKYIHDRRRTRENEGGKYWGMRIGIHTGKVIAGVVGKKKFAYDIWGDTVNLASRMESSGEDGRINISDVTYKHVKAFYRCQYRGGIVAKNKGSVDMYFVEEKIIPKTLENSTTG